MKCKVEVPEEVMEMALSQMDKFPGKTPEQVAVELIRIDLDELEEAVADKLKEEAAAREAARRKAMQQLAELSPDVLDYVVKPIEWVYNYTDGHDMDALTNEEHDRYMLICYALNEPLPNVQMTLSWGRAVRRAAADKQAREGD